MPMHVPELPEPDVNVRPLYVRKVDVNKFGYTLDCPGCRSIRSTPVGRSDVCRKRVMGLLSQSPEGADRVEKRKQIVDEAVAAVGERAHDRECAREREQASKKVRLSSEEQVENASSSGNITTSTSSGPTSAAGAAVDMDISTKYVAGKQKS